MNNFWLTLGIAGTLLQLVVISLMTRGFSRKYPGVFFYLLILFLTSVADFAGSLDPDSWDTWYSSVYNINNTVRQFGGYFAVISLYVMATERHPRRAVTRFRVIGGSLLLMVLTFAGNYGSIDDPEQYFTLVFRNMSFITAVLNLVLWFALVKTRTSDRILFLVSGGLGLNMAGEAIAESLRDLSGSSGLVASISVGSHILCLLIWIKALRLSTQTAAGPSRAPAG
jgi:hypothetical protein